MIIRILCCKRISHDESLDAVECQKSFPLLGNVDASLQLEGQQTGTGYLSLQEQMPRDFPRERKGATCFNTTQMSDELCWVI